ncbi:DUF2813 domain-containing protein [Rhizobium leguminosarum]|uniref:AAA family ATPase n=1 Tax=Rhizobium leguminosarum TaxID=384 RepID=UPI0010321816|nr:AAA family ATPase [Rhizobium leguminosarum]TAY15439.1 DUF2813 domain-containing protein [Rhizobium leguminosarum]
MHKLNKITIRGFKSIRSLSLELRPINVLIGANGSGKSNFIEAFTFLRAVSEGKLANYVQRKGGAERLIHFGSKHTSEMRFHLYFDESVNQYEIALEPTVIDNLIPTEEAAYYWNRAYPAPYREGLSFLGLEARIGQPGLTGVPSYVHDALSSWRVYHFHDTGPSSPLKKVSDLDDNRFLRGDGSNLAAFLYLLKEQHESEYKLIVDTIRRIAPFFVDFILQPRALNEETIRLEWSHKGADTYFDISDFSDGTLRFIALTTLLFQPKKYKASVILLDEPELGLHPSAIAVLGAMIRQASSEVQIIVSTQSPLLLDAFDPEDVLVVDRMEGTSSFTRLQNHALASWLSEYSLGELWEKNEIGGRPGGN